MQIETLSCAPETGREHKRTRGALISLLRGSFTCPTIAALAEMGLVDRMLERSFDTRDFPSITNKHVLSSLFRYLHSLNLLRAQPDARYELTLEGRIALKRNGAFLLLFSYRAYFENLVGLLSGTAGEVAVDRRHNVLGSGALHSKKFFPAVWEMFEGETPAVLIDIGCGDGQFLTNACAKWPGVAVAAVDLSPVAIDTTLERLETCKKSDVVGIVRSGADVAEWMADIPEVLKVRSPLVLSLWFVVHEFSGGNADTVVEFFQDLRSALPNGEIILGEVSALPPALLAKHCESSIMPELLLFHELSHQGVLSWEEWHEILNRIPYSLCSEKLFDVVGEASAVPSSFVWHLKP